MTTTMIKRYRTQVTICTARDAATLEREINVWLQTFAFAAVKVKDIKLCSQDDGWLIAMIIFSEAYSIEGNPA